MKKITEKERERFGTLGEKALASYLSNSDFVPYEWLDEEEAKEYNILFDKVLKAEGVL